MDRLIRHETEALLKLASAMVLLLLVISIGLVELFRFGLFVKYVGLSI